MTVQRLLVKTISLVPMVRTTTRVIVPRVRYGLVKIVILTISVSEVPLVMAMVLAPMLPVPVIQITMELLRSNGLVADVQGDFPKMSFLGKIWRFWVEKGRSRLFSGHFRVKTRHFRSFLGQNAHFRLFSAIFATFLQNHPVLIKITVQ